MRHLLVVPFTLLLTAGACSAQAQPEPVRAAPSEHSSVCLRGIDTPELRLIADLPEPGTSPIRHAPPREQVDSIPWQGKLFVPYGGSRSISAFLQRVHRVVRAGFIHGAAFYAEPDRIQNPEFLHLLDERDCTVQTFQEVTCTRPGVTAIEVRVVDANGSPIGNGLSGSFREDDYFASTDSARARGRVASVSGNVVALEENRPGIYTVEIRAPGYTTWRVGSVDVRPGRCRVERVTLRAYLEGGR